MEKIFIWGTGFISKQTVEQCDIFNQYDVLGFIDNDADNTGKIFYDKEIFLPCVLLENRPDKIVVLTNSYNEIKQQIMREFPDMLNIVENKNYFYKQSIINRYHASYNMEVKCILDFLKSNDLQVFNYDFVKRYENLKINIMFDNDCGMYFVYHKNRKLYFAKSLNTLEKVKKYYTGLLVEQDEQSPHRYLDKEFDVKEGSIVVDIGVAEGNFSLQIIDKVSKIYMIETDKEWVEALNYTFRDHKDKIIIIDKFVTSTDAGKYATLDNLIDEPVDFIKMDIEGNEWDALLGARQVISKSQDLKCAICCYHSDFDETLIRTVLASYGLTCSTTQGYMWYPAMIRQTYISTRLCRGIVRGIRQDMNQ